MPVIEEALRERGISARKASIEATGKPDLIREMRRGRAPSIDRLGELCRVLGLEFYVGRPRESQDRPQWMLALRDEISSEIRKEVKRFALATPRRRD